MAKSPLPLRGRVFVWGVIAAGAFTLAQACWATLNNPPGWEYLVLASFTLISGTLTIRVPNIGASISVSETFTFTAVLLFGPSAAAIICALDGLIMSISSKKRRLDRILFNTAESSVAISIASWLFFSTSGIRPLSQLPATPPIVTLLAPLALLATTYYLLNSSLIAIAVGIEAGKRPFELWRRHFLWLSLNYFGGASVAILLVRNSSNGVDPFGFAVIVPLMLVSYLTYKYSMGRVEDAARHIAELNSLYLSTIKTLAMAIDAKDQITHGHIRRVQLYAVGLARALGVHEDPAVRAIEAAALLHDTGKLAVPEYILNKPGKLTPGEFEKMKMHATVGADILSSIDFPYPVVPIVRHHHENWDGTGYPAGLKGTDIPIGARILAVVDCFDALTSDRPYRPKLADADALQILLGRRGTMYDPLVVDRFLQVYGQIKTEEDDVQQSSGLEQIAQSTKPVTQAAQPAGLEDIAASTEEMLALYDLSRALGGRTSLADAGDIVAKHLRRLLPASVCVFYLPDGGTDEIVAAHVAGTDAPPVGGLRIPIGQRISGWVAANHQTISNSDPVLDFGDLARSGRPRLRSCLSTPLIANDTFVGVLTLYSPNPNAFTEDHRRMIEAVALQISRVVRDSADFDREQPAFRDAVTGLPNLERLQRLTTDVVLSPESASEPLSLLFIDVDRLKDVNQLAGRHIGDAVLAHIADGIRKALRGADILFRYADDEFVVLLSQTDADTAGTICDRIRATLDTSPFLFPDGSSFPISIAVGIATYAKDVRSLADLIATARQRLEQSCANTNRVVPRIH